MSATRNGFLRNNLFTALKRRPLLVITPLYVALLAILQGNAPVTHLTPGTRIRIEGICISDPEQISSTNPDTRTLRFLFKPELIQSGNHQMEIRKIDVYLFTHNLRRLPEYGDRWSIEGRIIQGRRTAFLSAQSRDCRLISSGHGNSFKRACFKAREGSSELLSAGIADHKNAVAVIKALLLGYRADIPKDIRAAFISTGTLHIFAISGLHVGIIALLVTGILRRLRVSRPCWVLFIAPVLTAYTIATGARPSAVRACVMTVIFYFGPLLGRRADIPSAISAAALIILLIDPGQLHEPGFIFSFVVVIGIVILYPLFEPPLRRFWAKDPFSREEESVELTMLRRAGKYLAGLTALSMAAWLSSAPLTAYYFGRITPAALLSNLLVIPAALAIVFTGAVSIITGSCWIVPGMAINQINALLASGLTITIQAITRIPFGEFEIPGPGIMTTGLLYAVIFIPAIVIREKKNDHAFFLDE